MFFTEKKRKIEKNINESVNNIYFISEIYFYTKNVLCYKWNINLPEIYIHSAKTKNFDHKKYIC